MVLEVEDLVSMVTRRIPVTISHLMVESMAVPDLMQLRASNVVANPQPEEGAAVSEPEVAPSPDPMVAAPVAEAGVTATPMVAKTTEPEQAATPVAISMTPPVTEIDPEPKADAATPMATPMVAEPVAVPEEAHTESTSSNGGGIPAFRRHSDEIEVDDMGDMIRALVLTVAHFENL